MGGFKIGLEDIFWPTVGLKCDSKFSLALISGLYQSLYW